MRSRIDAILKSKAFYIVFSILASITLWVYVDYTVNEEIRETREGIPVEFINADYVTDRQLIITDKGDPTVAVTFEGRRGVVSRLDRNTVRAVVDLAQVNSTGQRTLTYKLVYDSSVDVRAISQATPAEGGYVTVTVEDIYKRDVLFEVRYGGNIAADGYRAEPAQLAQTAVTITGPRSLVENISRALVDVRRENLTRSVTEEMAFLLQDGEGMEIISELLTFGRDTVSVTIPISLVKDVTLDVRFIYGAGATTENVSFDIEPKTVTLSGPADALTINTIQLATIDLSSFMLDYTTTRQIAIPEGTQNLTGITEATITVSIRGLESSRFQTTNIEIINNTERYTTTLITESIDVSIRGPSDKLARVTAENIRVVADMTEYAETSGTFSVPARVYVDGSDGDVGAVGEYRVTVRVSYNPYGTDG